jgi:hypothetical protein
MGECGKPSWCTRCITTIADLEAELKVKASSSFSWLGRQDSNFRIPYQSELPRTNAI